MTFRKLSTEAINLHADDSSSDDDALDGQEKGISNLNKNTVKKTPNLCEKLCSTNVGKIVTVLFITLLLVFGLIAITIYLENEHKNDDNSSSFAWGTATASYQTEGAITADGRLPTVWDVFCQNTSKVYNNESGKIADRSYDLYQQDIELLTSIGVTHYRLSLAWSRILPDGITVNSKGIEHYRKVINKLNDNGITPMVTLFHWDLPQAVHTATNGGWINETIVDYYLAYASVVFENFHDIVNLWTTFNEPWTVCIEGYLYGMHAPGRCSDRDSCPNGNSSTEPYLCAHNMLLSHAYTVTKLFHNKSLNYDQNGTSKIGMNLNIDGGYPATNGKQEDIDAVERHKIWAGGWFADPLYFGDYSDIMKEYVNDGRLPTFSNSEKKILKGSTDFFALNHYTSGWTWECDTNASLIEEKTWETDKESCTSATNPINNSLIGTPAASSWLYSVPQGIYQTIEWVNNRYNLSSIENIANGHGIYITENGVDSPNENETTMVLDDTFRVNFLNDYIDYVMQAKYDGINVLGYFVWSLLDNFEWADGYSKRFGIHYVNFTDPNRTRIAKQSATWFKEYIQSHP